MTSTRFSSPDAGDQPAFLLGPSPWLGSAVVILLFILACWDPYTSACALVLLVMLGVAPRKSGLPRDGLALLMFAWLLWVPLSLTWSVSTGISLRDVGVLLGLPLAWLWGERRPNDLNDALSRLLPWLVFGLVVWGVWQGPATFTQKPQGPFNDPNVYAGVINLLILPLVARYFMSTEPMALNWGRMLALGASASGMLLAWLVSSRGAFIALSISLLPLCWVARTREGAGRKLAILLALGLAEYWLANWIQAGSGSRQDMVARLSETVQSGDPARWMLLQSCWWMIQDHPWLGTGLGTFRLLYPMYRIPEETATAGGWVHNDYLQLWQGAGLPMAVLVLGLVMMVVRAGWRQLRHADSASLIRMGYLSGLVAVLLQALVNFMIFHALVSVLIGFYLVLALHQGAFEDGALPVRGDGQSVEDNTALLVRRGYALILGYLLFGQVAVSLLLEHALEVQRALSSLDKAYRRYDAAYWLTVVSPFHPIPHEVMGLELAEFQGMMNAPNSEIESEALYRLGQGRRLAHCYLPYINSEIKFLLGLRASEAYRARTLSAIDEALACNPRHGLSYYARGLLEARRTNYPEALNWYGAGLQASTSQLDRIVLVASILAVEIPGRSEELAGIAQYLADQIRLLEASASVRTDVKPWHEAQYKLASIGGPRYFFLMALPELRRQGAVVPVGR